MVFFIFESIQSYFKVEVILVFSLSQSLPLCLQLKAYAENGNGINTTFRFDHRLFVAMSYIFDERDIFHVLDTT